MVNRFLIACCMDLVVSVVSASDVNPGQRIVDAHFVFPLMHLDAANPSNMNATLSRLTC